MSTEAESFELPGGPIRKDPVSRFAGLVSFLVHHMIFNLQAAMEYRVSFASQIILMVANDVLLLFFWWVLYRHLPDVGGWSRQETMLLLGVTAAAFGISVVVAGNVVRLNQLIADGQLDVYLLLPRDPLFHSIIGRMVVSGIGDVIFGAAVVWLLGPTGTSHRVMLAVATLLGGAIFVIFGILCHSLAFFLGNSAGLSSFLHETLLAFGMYPESIFPAQVRVLLFTAIPVGFSAYIPVQLVRNPQWSLVAYSGLFVLLLGRLSWLVFQSGLRRYQSGNLMTGRL